MDEQSYNEKFEALTDGLKYEKIYDALAERVTFVRTLAMHCADIYKVAWASGLPRGVAEQMAMEYFRYEITPSGMYVVESSEGDL